jgi:hypothetical protein
LCDEEAAILFVVREKKVWPAFQDTSSHIGLLGFRAKAFHEHFSEHAHEALVAATPNQGKRNLSSSSQHDKGVKLEREDSVTELEWSHFFDESHVVPFEINVETMELGTERPLSTLTLTDLDEVFLLFLL